MHETLLPDGWPRPSGYANGMAAHGRLIVVGGQVGWNAAQQFESDDLVEQLRQALQNIVAVLEAGGALPEHLVQLTWYFTDIREYAARLAEVGAVYREVIGRHYPAMAALEVRGFVEPRAKVEIQALAVVPE
ncbi:MAG: RidA family protein [Gemmatimonadaceae bacterium]|jgi:enamine deaminase RidA (YjgF/YER057c/UK114 family)|nr:RidA family protein [Gemmatimonadaceae bacterium]